MNLKIVVFFFCSHCPLEAAHVLLHLEDTAQSKFSSWVCGSSSTSCFTSVTFWSSDLDSRFENELTPDTHLIRSELSFRKWRLSEEFATSLRCFSRVRARLRSEQQRNKIAGPEQASVMPEVSKMKRPDVKIVLLGDMNVGKTSLLHRYMERKFKETVSTVGGAFFLKQWGPYNISIWDTAGNPSFTLPSFPNVYSRLLSSFFPWFNALVYLIRNDPFIWDNHCHVTSLCVQMT